MSDLLLEMSKNSLIVVAMTWGALIVELLIAACVLGSHRWRKVGLVLDVLLHGMIIATMGLWSFALVMIGSAILISMPALPVPRPVDSARWAGDSGIAMGRRLASAGASAGAA